MKSFSVKTEWLTYTPRDERFSTGYFRRVGNAMEFILTYKNDDHLIIEGIDQTHFAPFHTLKEVGFNELHLMLPHGYFPCPKRNKNYPGPFNFNYVEHVVTIEGQRMRVGSLQGRCIIDGWKTRTIKIGD